MSATIIRGLMSGRMVYHHKESQPNRNPNIGRASLLCACFFVLAAACTPTGKIAESSKTDECSAELIGALGAFARDMGLNFEPTKADADAFFEAGKVAKSYARDGVQYEAHFGIEKKGNECSLKFYKRVERQPGSRSSRTGSFGTVNLKVCKCE